MLLGTSNANPYIGAWMATFSKFATPLGMKVTALSSNYDAAVQSQQIDDAIAQKVDIIVLVYVNDRAIVPALTRAKAAGIPVMLWATPIKKEYEDLFTSYVGTDPGELGGIAGENMVKGLAAAGKSTRAHISSSMSRGAVVPRISTSPALRMSPALDSSADPSRAAWTPMRSSWSWGASKSPLAEASGTASRMSRSRSRSSRSAANRRGS